MTKQATDLGKDNIGGLLFKLALPAIIAQIVNVLYNIIDRIFIGRLPDGPDAMAGVGVAFPIIIIISAFSALLGMGGAPLAAIKMGEKNKDEAEKIMTNSFSMLIIAGLILTGVFFVFKEDILWAFGASPETIEYALSYLSIYLIGTIAVQFGLGMNMYINTQGFAKIGMVTVMVGAIMNIMLDPIFIFGFDMGVQGAALATIIAQGISALWVLWFFVGKQKSYKNRFLNEFIGQKSGLRIRKEYLIPNGKIALAIMGLGISPFIMQSTESLVIISFNRQLLEYGNTMGPGVGNLAISAMTIMSSIMQIITLPLFGLTQGAQPIISYNYGARQPERVKKTFKLLFAICMGYTTLMWATLMLVPGVFVTIFNKTDVQLMEFTSWSIRLFFGGILMCGAQTACQQTFLALGQAKISLFLALLRKIILLIPFIYILPHVLGGNQLGSIFLAESVADVLAATTTITCFFIFYKKTFKTFEEEQCTNELNQ